MEPKDTRITNLMEAIQALESQRAALGDAVVEDSIAALRKQLVELHERADPPEQQRKLVTILFADMIGSTNITRQLDPEEVMDIMDTSLKRLAAPIDVHGGHVTRFQGDGFMAVFGLPVAHENDPKQAIRAGLAIQKLAAEISGELQAERGITGFQVRVGINTGLVAAGGLTESQDTIMGKSVNLAARLESAAPPGGVLISQDSYRHVRGNFEVKSLEPIQAKGFEEPVMVYLVLDTKAQTFHSPRRGVEGVVTSMIGRHDELKHLQDALYTALEEREGQVVTILGEAGVGKSRLAYEFQNWIEEFPEQITLFLGRARQETQHTPYALLRDLFSNRFLILEDDLPMAAREKFEGGIQKIFDSIPNSETRQGIPAAHLIGQLLGFDFSDDPNLKSYLEDPQALRNRAFALLAEYFQSVSQLGPGVIILDDIHWADDSSLDAINDLGRKVSQIPVLIVNLARTSLFEHRPYWGEGQIYHRRMELQPLSKRESRLFVEEILNKVEQVPTALRELIVNGAEGNPYYIEELVKMLVEEGVIVKGEEYWSIEPHRLAEVDVPSTLVGVLQARLDSLPSNERTILQQASIVGRIFWDRVVRNIHEIATVSESGNGNRSEIDAALSALRSKEMVFRREESAFAQAHEYIFKHEILRDVAYETVLIKLRRIYHSVVADWLIEQAKTGFEEDSGLIADHLELAGREVEACTYLLHAGQKALGGYANSEAESYFQRAMELPGSPEERAHILEGLGQALALQANRSEAVQFWRKGIEVYLGLGDLKGVARLYIAGTKVYLPHWPVEALEIGSAGLAALSLMEECNEYVELLNEVGRAYMFKGQAGEAERLTQQALEMAKRLGNNEQQVISLRTLGILLFESPEKAIGMLQKAVRLAEASGSFNLMRGAHITIANVYNRILADHTATRDYYLRALRISRQRGSLWDIVFDLGNLIEIHAFLGDINAVQENFHEIEKLEGDAPEPEMFYPKLMMGKAKLARLHGHWDEAIKHSQEELADARRTSRVQSIYIIIVDDLFPAWTDYDRYGMKISWSEPEATLRELIELSEQAGWIWLGAEDVKCLLCAVLARQGRFEEARELLAAVRLRTSERSSALLRQFLAIAEAELSTGEEQWEDGIQALNALLEETRRASQRWDQARTLLALGDLYRERNATDDVRLSRKHYRQALEMFEKMGASGYIEVTRQRLSTLGQR